MFNALVGKAVNATLAGAQKTKAFMATPEGTAVKVAAMGMYLGYVLGAVVQHMSEEV